MGFFNSEWQQSPLGNQLSGKYSEMLNQPNYGYDANQGNLLEGARAKSLDTSKNAIRNLYASMGQGMNSPQMLRTLGRSQGDINTAYDTKKFDDESRWRQQVMQGAGQSAQMGQYQPAPAVGFMAPMMQGMGQSLGPMMGQGAANLVGKGFSSLVNGGQSLFDSAAPAMSGGYNYDALASATPDMFNTGAMGFDSLFAPENASQLFDTGFIGF